MEQGHDRRFALCKGGMDFFIGRHVKIHGKEHKLHGPCCATFWDLSSYEYSYASRNVPHNGLMMRHTYYRPQGQRCARTLPSFCVATGGRRDDRTPLTG